MAIVETRYGKVEGAANNGIHSFRGVPFAAPPAGEQRWRPPEPPASWPGVRAANGDWGKQAWQRVADNPDSPLSFVFNARNAAYRDEDCLQLNVWTPGLDDAKRPVMVWIHGGGFSGGTGGVAAASECPRSSPNDAPDTRFTLTSRWNRAFASPSLRVGQYAVRRSMTAR